MEFTAGRWPLDADRFSIVFIHGSGQCRNFWDAQVTGLSHGVNTVALSLPGHGQGKAKACNQISDYADRVSQFTKSMKIPNPVICGLSIGGAIAQYLMIHEPSLFRAGILINTGARLKVLPAIVETIENNFDQYLKMLIELGVAENNRSKAISEKVLACSNAAPAVTAADFKACDAFDVMGELDKITCPVLVLTAEKDVLTPQKYGKFLADNISFATLTNIADAGHMSPIEKPGPVNAAIMDFLESLTL